MAARRAARKSWFVYLLECGDGTLYTGVAIDVVRRLAEHNAGRGARYTRGRGPMRVVATSAALEKREAYRLEWQLKRRPAREKAAALRAERPVAKRRGPARVLAGRRRR